MARRSSSVRRAQSGQVSRNVALHPPRLPSLVSPCFHSSTDSLLHVKVVLTGLPASFLASFQACARSRTCHEYHISYASSSFLRLLSSALVLAKVLSAIASLTAMRQHSNTCLVLEALGRVTSLPMRSRLLERSSLIVFLIEDTCSDLLCASLKYRRDMFLTLSLIWDHSSCTEHVAHNDCHSSLASRFLAQVSTSSQRRATLNLRMTPRISKSCENQ